MSSILVILVSASIALVLGDVTPRRDAEVNIESFESIRTLQLDKKWWNSVTMLGYS